MPPRRSPFGRSSAICLAWADQRLSPSPSEDRTLLPRVAVDRTDLVGARNRQDEKGGLARLWGLLLGWIGVIIVALLSNKDPQPQALTAKKRELK